MVKEDKYELIINSAIELLQTENYQNMKTATIAKGAGIAEGTIYRYFKNKKEIFEEVIDITSDFRDSITNGNPPKLKTPNK